MGGECSGRRRRGGRWGLRWAGRSAHRGRGGRGGRGGLLSRAPSRPRWARRRRVAALAAAPAARQRWAQGEAHHRGSAIFGPPRCGRGGGTDHPRSRRGRDGPRHRHPPRWRPPRAAAGRVRPRCSQWKRVTRGPSRAPGASHWRGAGGATGLHPLPVGHRPPDTAIRRRGGTPRITKDWQRRRDHPRGPTASVAAPPFLPRQSRQPAGVDFLDLP